MKLLHEIRIINSFKHMIFYDEYNSYLGKIIYDHNLIDTYCTIIYFVVSVINIVNENPRDFSGNQLIDEIYLRSLGITNFDTYQCVPGSEPPKMNELINMWKS
jgi:hypothetical protein